MGVPRATGRPAVTASPAGRRPGGRLLGLFRTLLGLVVVCALGLFAVYMMTGWTAPFLEQRVDRFADRYLDLDGDGLGGGRGMCRDVEYPDGTVARCS